MIKLKISSKSKRQIFRNGPLSFTISGLLIYDKPSFICDSIKPAKLLFLLSFFFCQNVLLLFLFFRRF